MGGHRSRHLTPGPPICLAVFHSMHFVPGKLSHEKLSQQEMLITPLKRPTIWQAYYNGELALACLEALSCCGKCPGAVQC